MKTENKNNENKFYQNQDNYRKIEENYFSMKN